MSITMAKICYKSVCYPLKLIFQALFQEWIFLDSWKKGSIFLVHKNKSKNLLRNYRPFSLLQIFAKLFERLIFSNLFHDFIKNESFTNCQPGVLPVISVFLNC